VIGFQNHKNKMNNLLKFHYKTPHVQFAMGLQRHSSPQNSQGGGRRRASTSSATSSSIPITFASGF